MSEIDPRERLKLANDELHEAFQEIMLMEEIDVEKKALAGATMAKIFKELEQVHLILKDD